MSIEPAALTSLAGHVGWVSCPHVVAVEQRHVDAFSAAVGLQAGTGASVPPTFMASFLTEPPPVPGIDHLDARWLNGGDTFEHRAPVHVGDVLTHRTELSDVTTKRGRRGPMTLLTMTTDFVLADGATAVRHRGVRILL